MIRAPFTAGTFFIKVSSKYIYIMDPRDMTFDWARGEIEKVQNELRKLYFGIDRTHRNCLIGACSLVPYDKEGEKGLGQAHVLAMAAPGYGKTGSARGLANAMTGKYSFIQGQPELKKSDIVGDEEYDKATEEFYYSQGPIFGNFVVFDEITRTNPKPQSFTLQSMEERVAIVPRRNKLTRTKENELMPLYPIAPGSDELFFWMIATANPFEKEESTYDLPKAQLDRFSISFDIDLPPEEDEARISLDNVYSDDPEKRPRIKRVMDLKTLLAISKLITKIRIEKTMNIYMVRLGHNSRPITQTKKRPRHGTPAFLDYIDNLVKAGLSPRSRFHFQAIARTVAFMNGRDFVSDEDVKEAARLVMPHRIILEAKARGKKIRQMDIVEEILENTPLEFIHASA